MGIDGKKVSKLRATKEESSLHRVRGVVLGAQRQDVSAGDRICQTTLDHLLAAPRLGTWKRCSRRCCPCSRARFPNWTVC